MQCSLACANTLASAGEADAGRALMLTTYAGARAGDVLTIDDAAGKIIEHDRAPSAPQLGDALTMFAWVGEDELGKREIGIKRAYIDNNLLALVMIDGQKAFANAMFSPALRAALQDQANTYGKTIRLMRFEAVELLDSLEPEGATGQ